MIRVDFFPTRPANLGAADLQDGCAYLGDDGRIYVGNVCENYVAFSLCGARVIEDNSLMKFSEVDLHVSVTHVV